MRQRELKPILDKDQYAEKARKAIEWILWETIYRPVLEILDPKLSQRENSAARDSLMEALKIGLLQYVSGYIVGKMNASVSREIRSLGGTWDVKRKAFKLDLSGLPIEVREAIAAGAQKNREKLDELKKKLQEIKDVPAIKFEPYAESIVEDLEAQMKKVTPKDIEIPMELSPSAAEAIKTGYSENLNLEIKGWRDEEVLALREKVEKNVAQGFRAEKLAEVIKAQYGVTQRKARFLARQETSLLVSKYRQERYEGAGLRRYKWSTSHDERVRPDHKALNGQIFSWDSPPITNRSTGDRNHPGEDFGCRCVAMPIVTTGE